MKKFAIVLFVAALSVAFSGATFCADESGSTASAQQATQKAKMSQRPMMDKNIAFISGSISKIDTTTPGSTKVEIVNSMDGKSHVVEVGANTNILKVVEIGELKAGDKARVVAKKTADKETAISIVAGNLKEMQIPRPKAMGQAPVSTTKK